MSLLASSLLPLSQRVVVRFLLPIHVLLMTFSSLPLLAAEVEYSPPNLTIVAEDETLQDVLSALEKAMGIAISSPAGVNPRLSCDVRNQPVAKALEKLLGGFSYSLVWADDGNALTGLVILSPDDASDFATVAPSSAEGGHAPAKVPIAPRTGHDGSRHVTASDQHDARRLDSVSITSEEHRVQMAIDETERRRKLQQAYNEKHGITPETVRKNIRRGIEADAAAHQQANEAVGRTDVSEIEKEELLGQLEQEMHAAANELDFERAAQLRDQISAIRDGGDAKVGSPRKSGRKRARRGGREVPRPKKR